MKTIPAKWCALTFAAALALVGTPSFAASPESEIAMAENSYAALDYPPALSGAEAVLGQRGLSHDLLTRATRVAALSHAALGHGDQAKQLFTLLLQYDPDFKVDPKLGPRFSDPFAEARGYWLAQGRKPGLDVQVLVQYGQLGQIRTSTVDPMNVVRRVTVGFRWAPSREYTTTSVDPSTHTIDVPAKSEGGAARLDYFVRALDARDNAVFETGAPDSPKSLVVNEPPRTAQVQGEKKSILSSPVFYLTFGAILAGAAVGSYFLFRPTEYSAPATARSTLVANCGAERCS